VVTLVAGFTVYTVETPVPVAEIQNGPGPYDIPQALIKFGSVICAGLVD